MPRTPDRYSAAARSNAKAAERPEGQVLAASRPATPRIAGSDRPALPSRPQGPGEIDVGGSPSPQVRQPLPLDFILVDRSPVPILRILAKPTARSEFGMPGASPDIGEYGQTYVAAIGGQIEVRLLTKTRDSERCIYDVLATLNTGGPISMKHLRAPNNHPHPGNVGQIGAKQRFGAGNRCLRARFIKVLKRTARAHKRSNPGDFC